MYSRIMKPVLLIHYIAAVASTSHGPRVAGKFNTEAIASRDYFYVGGSYVSKSLGTLFSDQMYVEKLSQTAPSQPYPLVFIHEQAQTGTNWLNKPDGGPGWATYFLNRGYTVYLIDQTERARIVWSPVGNTALTAYAAEIIQRPFTAPEKFKLWQQATLRTQWPGTGLMGDSGFDAYYASNVQWQSNTVIQETKMQATGSALLDTIGPAVLISHSQGGLVPWLIADVRPDLVKAIVSIEPTLPPFQESVFTNTSARPWGLTDIPLTYYPAPTNRTSPLEIQIIPNDAAGLEFCIIQADPARKLVNLQKIPVLLETSEASYHAVYDDCTFAFLEQASVPVERLKLADIGINGN